MKWVMLIAIVFLAGCASPPDFSQGSPLNLLRGGPQLSEEQAADPMISAAVSMTRIGVLLCAGGLVFAAVTRFRTGWGLSIAAAGFLMILLAWTFSQPWVPWVGLATVVAYGGYKIYNKVNPNVETEHLLQ